MIDKDVTCACAERGARNVAGIHTKIVKGARSAPDNPSINKIQSKPDDLPVSVDLNSNNSNLNSGPNCALLQLKSTCRLFQRKIDVSAFPTKNRRVGFSNKNSTCRIFPLGRRYVVYCFIYLSFITFLQSFCLLMYLNKNSS